VCVFITVAVVWRSFAVKGFWALWDNIYYVCVFITVAVVWRSFDVKGFWALWDNIYDDVFSLF
jgi:hypothetical protein